MLQYQMLTLQYFQDANDVFDSMAFLNDAGVMSSFHTALESTRQHLVKALQHAQPDGLHEALLLNFHIGTMLLMTFFDGLAVYVEKKVAHPASSVEHIYWASHTTFLDPQFAVLRSIQQRTNDYIIKGGISANTLRNFAKHYLPWVPLTDSTHSGAGVWDIRFPINAKTKSGPLLHGLLFPLFDDACEAYRALGALMHQPVREIPTLVI
jgi:hypothetical protein